MKKNHWTTQNSSDLYGIPFWGAPYFSVNEDGHIQVHPKENLEFSIDLFKTINELRERHVRIPILLRFPDIIKAQMKKICQCFDRAIKEQAYQGRYYGAFPIKVNQQRHIVEDIISSGYKYNFGLEAGSKPELLVALALMDNPEALIICNGFKDRSYIEMALISQKAGKNIFLVVERTQELHIILEMSKELNIKPKIGFRLKLNTQSDGLWGNTSGSNSKFGLTPSELVSSVQFLKEKKFLDCLELIHFHIGSQIPSIQPIKSAIKETARIFYELTSMGCCLKYVDVGGGLGVDYDGSGVARSSTNYDVQEYANDVVFGLQNICNEKGITHPHIISESGRFLLAQSSILVFNVLDSSHLNEQDPITVHEKSHYFIKEMYDIYKNISHTSYNETFNDLVEKRKEISQLFVHGVLSLEELAQAENIYWKSMYELKQLVHSQPDYEEIFDSLKEKTTDTYFCNFSVFQSVPDSWALSYIFPVMPIHRLEEEPTRRAQLVDLTCDSDGRISKIIDYKTWKVESHLPVHKLKPDEDYFIGVFLTGAYQEILGDLHNLFGDTDVVHIKIGENQKYIVEHRVEGDSISEILDYVEYHRKDLLGKIHKATEDSVLKGKISRQEAGFLLEKFENNLSHYTYLK